MLTDEMKTKWINALESGEYEQGQGKLECNGKFCGLGVFCLINDIPRYSDNNETGYVWLKSIIGDEGIDHIIQLNDLQHKTFPEIATWIKENL